MKRITEGDGDPRHGTINGYNNLRCRCAACRKAHADYFREGRGAVGKWRYRDRLIAEGLRTDGGGPRTIPYAPRPNSTRSQIPTTTTTTRGNQHD